MKKTVRRTDTTGEANPLTGLVYCADCGAKMYNHRGGRKKYPDKGPDPATGLYSADSYDCSTYTLTFQNMTNKCFSHHISTKALRALILETIRMVSRYAISNEAEFTKRVREASRLRQAEVAKDHKRKMNRDRKCSAELDGLIKKLYETFATGKLTEKRFELLSAAIEQAQVELDTARVGQFLALAKKYTDFTELTTPMLHEFIEKILVHASDRSSGERVQEVEIHLKFIGRFDVPMPEELAEEERRRKRREANHRKYLRKKERERQKKLAAGQEAET